MPVPGDVYSSSVISSTASIILTAGVETVSGSGTSVGTMFSSSSSSSSRYLLTMVRQNESVEDVSETLNVIDSLDSVIIVDYGGDVVTINKAAQDDGVLLELGTDGEDLPILGGLEPVEKDLAGFHLAEVLWIGDLIHDGGFMGRKEP